MLIVRGTCNESVLIDRDDVVLQGDSNVGGTVRGPNPKLDTILVSGSRITISGLSITGGQNGITAFGASNVSILGSAIRDTAASGVKVVGSQNVYLEGNRIERNADAGINLERAADAMVNNTEIRDNAGAGLHVGEKSNVSAARNTISSNGSNGVESFDGGHASLWDNTIAGNGTNDANNVNFRNGIVVFATSLIIGGNRITNHPASGVRASASALSIADNTITGNGEGVTMWLASQLVSGGNTISNNKSFGVLINENSTVRSSGETIQFNSGDGLLVQWGSKLILVEPSSTVGGNVGVGLRCSDAEASVVGMHLINAVPPNGQGEVRAHAPLATRNVRN